LTAFQTQDRVATRTRRAGYTAAFVARRGKALFPLAPRPDIVAADLNQVSSEIVRTDGV
jgi:hypothetical protein